MYLLNVYIFEVDKFCYEKIVSVFKDRKQNILSLQYRIKVMYCLRFFLFKKGLRNVYYFFKFIEEYEME